MSVPWLLTSWRHLRRMGPSQYKSTVLPTYSNSHYKDKTVSRPYYLYNGNPVPGKTVFTLRRGPDHWGWGWGGCAITCAITVLRTLQWRHNELDGVSNHQPYHCLLSCLFGRRSKKTSKLRVTGLCAGNSPGTGEFPAQMVSNAENVSIWWRHHGKVRNQNMISYSLK